MKRGWKADGIIYTADINYREALKCVGSGNAFRAEMDPPDPSVDDGAHVSVRANGRKIMSDFVSLFVKRGFKNFGFYGTEDPSERNYSEMCERHLEKQLSRRNMTLTSLDIRGCGRLVGEAVEFIRTAPLETLTVEKTVSHMRISRRLAEMNFKKVLGHGIHAHILQRRLETLRGLVIKTKTPIENLSLSCGFRTAAAARIAYRKRYGTSMTADRRSS